MKNSNRFRWRRLILPLLILVAALVFMVVLAGNRDTFIIYNGIQGFRSLQLLSRVFLGIGVGAAFGVAAYEGIRFMNGVKQEAIKEASEEEEKRLSLEAKRQDDAYLSAKGQLVERLLREELKKYGAGEWKIYASEIENLIRQSVRMDEYQEKLAGLLRKNGAERLDDAEDVLNRAEQYLLQNIRKVLNFLEVCEPEKESEREKVRESITDCFTENTKVLDNTSDFMIALTTYLNEQGGSAKEGMDSLNTYKQILINSTKQEEKVYA